MAPQNIASDVNFYAKIQADPDIPSAADFERFVEYEERTTDHRFNIPASLKQSNVSQYAPIRGETVRPGFKIKIKQDSERLRNSPNERREFEIWPRDTIPFSTYRRMSYDPVIQFNTLLLKGWIAGLKFSVDSNDERVKHVTEYVLGRCYANLVRDLLGALAYGFSFGEKVWQREEVKLERLGDDGEKETVFSGSIVSFRKIKFINPDAGIRYYKNKNDEISKITQTQSAQKVTVKRKKLVWFALDREFSGVFGRSRYKAVYDEWYYYQINKQQMLRHVQRTGSPPLKGRYPDGTAQLALSDQNYFGTEDEEVENVVIAEQLAEAYLNQGIILLPSERDEQGEFLWDLEFDRIENADTSPFITVLKLLAQRMSEGIGVPASLGQGDSNLAEQTAQSELMIVVVEDLVEQLEEVIRQDVVNQIVAYNFGPEAVQDVKFTIDKTGLGRRKHFKDIYINALRLAMSKSDYLPKSYPDLHELGREIGIPHKPMADQLIETPSEIDGETPANVAQQKEDSNDPARRRPNKTDRDPRRRESPKDDTDNTGAGG